MKFLPLICIITVFLISSCDGGDLNSEDKNQDAATKGFHWIEGKYVMTNDQSGFYYEEWKKVDDNTYIGTGHFLSRDCIDTVFSMKMRLIHEKEKTTLFYDVRNQNNNKETEFTLTKAEDNMYVFENPFRDFPSIMQYKLIGDSVIEVTERGFYANKEKVIDYRVTKIN